MFSSLNTFTKYLKPKKVSTQDFVFTLHSKVTFALLLTASVLLSLNQFFGEPIECKGTDEKDKVWAEQYCWTHGTYIFNYEFEKKNFIKQNHVVGYGIHSKIHSIDNLRSRLRYPEMEKDEDRVYLRYYQWVVLILTLQAFSFALPAFIWKIWEKNRLQQLCENLDEVIYDNDGDNQKNRIQYLRKYFSSGINDINFCYAIKYCLCELLNFGVCIMNVILMNVFFMNFWSQYASVLNVIPLYNWSEWNFYTSKIFPKIVKCDIHVFGSSGTIEKKDYLCLLPLNILNEKIFVVFYIWFLGLTILSGLNILFRISLMVFKSFRVQLLRAQARYLKTRELSKVLSHLNYGDWYLLYKICCNSNPLLFKALWIELKPLEKNEILKADV